MGLKLPRAPGAGAARRLRRASVTTSFTAGAAWKKRRRLWLCVMALACLLTGCPDTAANVDAAGDVANDLGDVASDLGDAVVLVHDVWDDAGEIEAVTVEVHLVVIRQCSQCDQAA